jgi:peroxiredoxin
MSPILAAGTIAPNFTLRVTPDQNLMLSDLRGKPVIPAFYPADWSPVCGDQMTLYKLYNEIPPEFRKHDAELLGISVEGCGAMPPSPVTVTCISRCSPISKPKGDVARKYRAYRASEGVCERALFVLDRQGHHRVELLLSDRCQSRRRRNS